MKLKQIQEARYGAKEEFYVVSGWISRGLARFDDPEGPFTAEEAADVAQQAMDDYPHDERTDPNKIIRDLKSYNGMFTCADGTPLWDYGYDEGVIGITPGRPATPDDYGNMT